MQPHNAHNKPTFSTADPAHQPARLGNHALVVGGSIGGMMTARVLSDHFARVTIVERDPVDDTPTARKGQPQARHVHGLLAMGRETMERLYPGVTREAIAAGALPGDLGQMMRWYILGGWRKQFTAGVTGLVMSRPLLEWVIRRRTLALPNVTLLDDTAVVEPLWSSDKTRVLGLRIQRRRDQMTETLAADLVVDVSGRGSASPKWLEAAGYDRPEESVVKIDVAYASQIFEAWPGNPLGDELMMIANQDNLRTGLVFPIEGGRWIASLGGRGDDVPPTDPQAFIEYARTLEAPEIYELLRHATPLTPIVPHRFPSNLRRHYEQMARFPEGYLVLGDAICSFNPVYGQGMSVASLEAQALQQILARRVDLKRVAQEFFKAAAQVVAVPWQTTVGEDFRYPTTQGKKPPMVDLINAYVAKVHKATHHDEVVYAAFLKVMNLQARPESLFAPRILRRVLFGGRGRTSAAHHQPAAPRLAAAEEQVLPAAQA